MIHTNTIPKSIYRDANAINLLLKDGIIQGYSSVYNNIDSQGNIIQAGAFDNYIDSLNDNDKIPILYDHCDPPIGYISKKDITSDQKGLYIKGHLYKDRQKVKNIIESINDNTINDLSISFASDKKYMKSFIYNNQNLKSIGKGQINEISIVLKGANNKSKIEKSLSFYSSTETYDPFDLETLNKLLVNNNIATYNKLVCDIDNLCININNK